MKIKGGLKIESGDEGKTAVEVWSVCSSIEDVDDLIAWLGLAKHVIREWEKINAKASRATKAAAGKDEASERGQVQGAPHVAERPDGEHLGEATEPCGDR